MTKVYAMTLKISGTDKKVKWSSSNHKIATVSKKGRVKGKKSGKCTVTAKVCGIKFKCKVTVKSLKKTKEAEADFKSVTLNITSLKIDVNNIKYISDGMPVMGNGQGHFTIRLLNNKKDVTWTSSDDEIATVSKGRITAHSEGKCKIEAVVGKSKYICKVRVTDLNDAKLIYNQESIYEMLGLINVDRVKAKVAPLSFKESLNTIADVRAKECYSEFSHTRPDGSPYYSVYNDIDLKKGTFIGENIAYVYNVTSDMDSLCKVAYKALYHSKGHRENMLDPSYKQIGIGIYTYIYGDDGFTYAKNFYTQEFYCK
jgi:uncharacterized protein YkwD